MQFLVDEDLIKNSPSMRLNKAYAEAGVHRNMRELGVDLEESKSNKTQVYNPRAGEEKLLLSQSSGQLIADYIKIPELAVEIQRAVWQIERTLQSPRDLSNKRDRHLESLNKININR